MIATVTGSIEPDALGKTLMHEHLHAGFSGWETDILARGPTRREMVSICVDRIEELKSAGYRTLIDPCPNDLGRDVDLMGEVAVRTGFNIIAATGFYHETLGANAYWRTRARWDPETDRRLADVMIHELTEGVGNGARAGLIKLGTGSEAITSYEEIVIRAAAKAAVATGAVITTHTNGVLGDQQLALLTSLGVSAHKVIIGHCDGSSDDEYLDSLIEAGAYIGLDRFGAEFIRSDAERIEILLRQLNRGCDEHLIVSHDSVWCMRGEMMSPQFVQMAGREHHPLRFERHVTPLLSQAGISRKRIDALLTDNPRRYFEAKHACRIMS